MAHTVSEWVDFILPLFLCNLYAFNILHMQFGPVLAGFAHVHQVVQVYAAFSCIHTAFDCATQPQLH